MSTRSAAAQLRKLTEAVQLTKRDIRANEEGHARTRRELKAAQDEMEQYHARLAVGEIEADEREEDRLVARVNRIRSRLHDEPGREPYDVAVEARARHLKKALTLQEERRDSWIRQNKAALIAEGVEMARAERELTAAVIPAMRARVEAWRAVESFWRGIAPQLEILPEGDIPTSPLIDALQAAETTVRGRGGAAWMTSPAPWWCLPDDELTDERVEAAIDRRNPDRARARVTAARAALHAELGQ